MSDRPVRDEGLERVLRERADALAVPDDEPDTELIDLALLHVGGERHAVELDRLLEVRTVDRVTPVPGVPPAWAGMIPVRGSLFPVLDLARFLGLAETSPTSHATVALVSAGGTSLGILVDGVPEVTRVRLEELAGANAAPESPSRAVTGVTPGLVSLLDVDALLLDPRINLPVPTQTPGGNR